MSTQAALQSLWDKPFELLLALESRLRASGESRAHAVAAQDDWVGLGFMLGQVHYLAPQADVNEILEMPVLTRVPRARPWLLGVANVRGDLLPLIDLGRLVGSSQTHITAESRVIVLHNDEVPAGFLVDSVAGFRRFGPQDQRHELLENEPMSPITQRFLLGAFVSEGTAWRVFSLQKLAADAVFRDAGV